MRDRYDQVRAMIASGCDRHAIEERFGIGPDAAYDLIQAANAGVSTKPRRNRLNEIRRQLRDRGNKRIWAQIDDR